MQLRQRGLLAGIMMATLIVAPLAEAKRAGGGKSHGMSRSAAPSQSYQKRQAAPAQQPTPAPQRSGPGVGSMVGAGVAGAAIGAVAANALASDRHDTTTPEQQATTQHAAAQQQAQQEQKSGFPGWIWIILAAAIAFFIFRRFSTRQKVAGTNPFAPNNSGSSFGKNSAPRATTTESNTNIFGQTVATGSGSTTHSMPSNAPFGAAYTNNGNLLPDGTESATFLRIARQRFTHIQSVNSASNIQEIKRYLTPELYASMHHDIMSNQDHDVAEFSNINAMVTDSTTENGQYIVSVRFTGTVSEDLNSLPQPFAEIWHFVKPINSSQDWLVAGIQQN